MLVTTHNAGSRLNSLIKAGDKKSSLPKAPPAPPKAPLALKTPAAPQRRGISHLPPKIVPKARQANRAIDPNRASTQDILSDFEEQTQAIAGDEFDGATEAKNQNVAINKIDLSKIDPGPEIADVPCGFNCGSCIRFLKLNDPRRNDPEFMEAYLASNERCPVALPELVKLKKDQIIDNQIARANTTACQKFKLSRRRCTSEFLQVMDTVKCLDKGEFDILAASMDSMSREKSLEDRYGYKLGEVVKTQVQGIDHLVDARVTGFQGKSVIAKAKYLDRVITVKIPVAVAKVIEE
jgi:hypothetical protein